ncbi:hypothetical protein DM02DRAFT_26554 [Periconia macrospinosa]|uniref:Uncharacterized protein n=1 Tax=Periconia macrospinosa TaxID=97972 RepID=A0A2V1DNN6_9PLEO|nr:hypothetical protein DM02DRAFT_26554 [Periconia macrospinosa]
MCCLFSIVFFIRREMRKQERCSSHQRDRNRYAHIFTYSTFAPWRGRQRPRLNRIAKIPNGKNSSSISCLVSLSQLRMSSMSSISLLFFLPTFPCGLFISGWGSTS